jgi:hypothetical protein
MAQTAEHFSVPDDLGPIRASDLYTYDRLRVFTDVQASIVPLILLGAAIFIWLTVRILIRADGGRIGRLVKLRFDAKERELRDWGRGDRR